MFICCSDSRLSPDQLHVEFINYLHHWHTLATHDEVSRYAGGQETLVFASYSNLWATHDMAGLVSSSPTQRPVLSLLGMFSRWVLHASLRSRAANSSRPSKFVFNPLSGNPLYRIVVKDRTSSLRSVS